MGTSAELAVWLRSRDDDSLTAMLELRADGLAGASPRSFTELAERLLEPGSIVSVLRGSPLPCLQIVEALAALGDRCTRDELAGLLDENGREDGDVDAILNLLFAHGLIWTDERDRLMQPAAFAQMFVDPLGLGPPLRTLLEARPVDSLRRMQAKLGLKGGKNRAEVLASVLEYFADQARVRAVLATAPSAVAAYLTGLAAHRSTDEAWMYDSRSYRARQEATQWAGDRGLLVNLNYSYEWRLPAEVARALRGPDYRAPFQPREPVVAQRPIDRRTVETDSAAAASQFAAHALDVLDHVARVPVAQVKSGGLGSRALTQVAKLTGASETEVRLCLELAAACDLVDPAGPVVRVSAEFSGWRDAEPADRFAALLLAWWTFGATPTDSHHGDGTALRALSNPGHCEACRDARVVLLTTVRGFDAATDVASVGRAAIWRGPLVHLAVDDAGVPFATVWREAELLGVLAQGALSTLGRLLMDGDLDGLRTHAATLLPASADRATFGADLTVFVAGAPSGRVSALLDATADRESRGGAVTWRFSPASVRRAFDGGRNGDGLTAELAAIATAELPQALRYLITDVARRYGNLRLSPVTTCIRSDEQALLAELAANRKLAKFGLRLLAPTVLASDTPLPALMTALRAAGYFPVSDSPDDPTSASVSFIGGAAAPATDHDDRAELPGNVVLLPTRPSSPSEAPIALLSRAELLELYPLPELLDPASLLKQLRGRDR